MPKIQAKVTSWPFFVAVCLNRLIIFVRILVGCAIVVPTICILIVLFFLFSNFYYFFSYYSFERITLKRKVR